RRVFRLEDQQGLFVRTLQGLAAKILAAQAAGDRLRQQKISRTLLPSPSSTCRPHPVLQVPTSGSPATARVPARGSTGIVRTHAPGPGGENTGRTGGWRP
ncbi:hypothetical protein ACNQTB_12345, partial [Corynebacterium diphtheriae]